MRKEKSPEIRKQIAESSHHIKNILNKLEGGAYMVNSGLKRNKPDILSRGWKIVETNIQNVSDLLMNILFYAEEREPDFQWCSPNDIALEVFDQLEERARHYGVILSRDFEPKVSDCYLDPEDIERCLLNVVIYTLTSCDSEDRNGKGSSLIIKTSGEREGIRFDLLITGTNFFNETGRGSFEKLYGEETKGGGLGLRIAHEIVEKHRGAITLESTTGKKTTLSIHLPINPEESG